jgi:Pyruvate/2-oxoacid:ferredoxin oxidoreductase delta subunit
MAKIKPKVSSVRKIRYLSSSQRNRRIKELELLACTACWSFCFENGLTEEEQAEYNELMSQ